MWRRLSRWHERRVSPTRDGFPRLIPLFVLVLTYVYFTYVRQALAAIAAAGAGVFALVSSGALNNAEQL
jgi:hypothetical protein